MATNVCKDWDSNVTLCVRSAIGLTLLSLSDGPLRSAFADAPTNAILGAIEFKSVNREEAVDVHKLQTLTPLACKTGIGATPGLTFFRQSLGQ